MTPCEYHEPVVLVAPTPRIDTTCSACMELVVNHVVNKVMDLTGTDALAHLRT